MIFQKFTWKLYFADVVNRNGRVPFIELDVFHLDVLTLEPHRLEQRGLVARETIFQRVMSGEPLTSENPSPSSQVRLQMFVVKTSSQVPVVQ